MNATAEARPYLDRQPTPGAVMPMRTLTSETAAVRAALDNLASELDLLVERLVEFSSPEPAAMPAQTAPTEVLPPALEAVVALCVRAHALTERITSARHRCRL